MEPKVGETKWKDHAKYVWRGKALGWRVTGEHEPGWTNTPHAGEPEGSRDRKSETALSQQIGGSHYKDMAIQPIEFVHKNGIGYMEGCAIKYLCRWRKKGGIEDLKKARHFIDQLIEMEGAA